jgi:hypothetical protein
MTLSVQLRDFSELDRHKLPVACLTFNSDELAKIDQKTVFFHTRTALE